MNEQSLQEIISRKASAKKVEEYRKWEVLDFYFHKKLTRPKIAEITEVPLPTVYGWISKYKKGGAQLLLGKRRGGRQYGHMSLEDEKKFLDGLLNLSSIGQLVTAKIIHQKAEAQLGHSIGKDFAYDLLKRHGWKKLAPRPSHPKSSKEEKEEFKKNFRK